MSSPAPSAKKKLPLLKIGAGLAALAVAAVLVLRGLDVRALIDQGMGLIREAGPVAFFVAMAVLPAAGVPALTFSLTAGPAFGEKLGMGVVLAWALVAVTANMMLSYALARGALRPLFEMAFRKLGYKLPAVESGDQTDLIVILRVTPGVPFPVQNYLLGLAGVPFGKYLGISFVIVSVYQTGFILFGDALIHGKGKLGLIAVSVLVAAVAITHLVRKHYGKKKAARAA